MWDVLKQRDRTRILLIPALGLAAILLAGMAMHMLTEAPGTNSYGLMADAFLHGRMDVFNCFDSDCVTFNDKVYVIFPPVPAVVAMPFVAMFGTGFHAFASIGFACFIATLILWWRIFERLGVEPETIIWLLLALAFGSPLYYVSIRADRVWFFAQSINFLLLTLALFEILRGGRLLLAGIYMGLAFLSRQMTILLAPFLFVLALREDENLISFRAPYIKRALSFGLPILAAVAVYLVYNQLRFGDPMETGYRYIAKPALDQWSLINERLVNHGLFSKDYLLFNSLYLFVQGFHLEFGGPSMLTPVGLDQMGTSLLAASPFVLLVAFMPFNRRTVVGGLCAILILGVTLFYHGNGYSQYNVQRFVLDWAVVLFFLLGLTVHKNMRPAFAVLATYAIGLNVIAMVALALLHQS
jgi:hypothetical protein